MEKAPQELSTFNDRGKKENASTWEENEESFTRRAQEDVLGMGRKKRRVLRSGNSLISYIEKDIDNSNSGRAVKRFEELGVKAILCEGNIETNQNSLTTSHSEAVTAPDGTVYVSSESSLPPKQTFDHEMVHVAKKTLIT